MLDWGIAASIATVTFPSIAAAWAAGAWSIRMVIGRVDRDIEKERETRAAQNVSLEKEVVHNRASADQKFIALELRVDRNAGEIVALGKADVEHSVAIRHLEATIRDGVDGLKQLINSRLDDAALSRKAEFDQLADSIREIRNVTPRS